MFVPEGLALSESGASIYETETPVFLADGNENYYLDDESNTLSARSKLEWIRGYVEDGSRILDVGSGYGHFLSVARDHYAVAGLELAPAAVAAARERLGVDCVLGSVYAMPDSLPAPFAVATGWDLIEHLPDPLAALRAIREVLAPGGLLFLSTPDTGSLVARLMARRWHYLDPVQHVVLFNRRNLRRVLERSGFEVLAWNSFGRRYRLRYLCDRLRYLHDGPIRWGGALMSRLPGPALAWSIYLHLRDVLSVAARRCGEPA